MSRDVCSLLYSGADTTKDRPWFIPSYNYEIDVKDFWGEGFILLWKYVDLNHNFFIILNHNSFILFLNTLLMYHILKIKIKFYLRKKKMLNSEVYHLYWFINQFINGIVISNSITKRYKF